MGSLTHTCAPTWAGSRVRLAVICTAEAVICTAEAVICTAAYCLYKAGARWLSRAALSPVSKPSAALRAILLACLLALCLAGCTGFLGRSGFSIVTLTDPEASQENTQTVVASADPGQTVGQTFSMRRPRLNGLTLWVDTSPQDGALQVELYHTPAGEPPLFTQTIPFSSIVNGVLNIRLPPSPSLYWASYVSPPPAQQAYYILLRPLSGTVQVHGRAEDIYPSGQAFSDQTPLQADFAFTTTYDYDLTALLGDLRASLPRLWLVLPLMAILFLPGWLLLDISGLRRRFDSGEQTGLAIGLSLAIIPLAMLWSTSLSLRWGRPLLLVTSALLLAAAFWRVSRELFRPDRRRPDTFSKTCQVCLTGVFALTLGVRLVMARDLAAPAWVDSVHHATITRLILEHGGFPATYSPYIDIDAVEYHAGFHSIQAVFQWLSGLAAPEAMLLLGQVLNALIVFAVYLLAVTLTRQPAAGLAAAAVAGLFTPMPAYYTSWGRYTQLAGLLILPAGLALARLVIERRDAIYCVSTRPRTCVSTRPRTWLAIGLAAAACGGLFLVHYRVAGFLALLLLSYFLSQAHLSRLANTRLAKRIAVFTGAAGLLALLLTLPWSWQTITQVFAPKAAVVSGASAKAFEGFYWGYLTAAWGLPAMVLAGLGFLISLFRKPRLAITLALWTASLLLVANLSSLHLPGSWFVNTISVAIILFMPTAVLAGYALGQVYYLIQAVVPLPGKVLSQSILVVLGFALALLAARSLLPILRPSTNLFRSADRPAMAWIAQNIPADEIILINPIYWGYGTYAGADGGFWITPLTGRKTVPPPVLYALGQPVEKQLIRAMCEVVLAKAADAAALAEILRGQGIHYIYLGARGGVLSPQALLESDQFEVLYAKQGAWVFAMR